MQKQEAEAQKQYPPQPDDLSPPLPAAQEIRTRGTQCLQAIRHSARSDPGVRLLDSSTNLIDRAMEICTYTQHLFSAPSQPLINSN